MNCFPKLSLHSTSLQKQLRRPIAYESHVYVIDIVDRICSDIYRWITEQKDLECEIDYDSFFKKYVRVFYQGFQTRYPSDTVTDYFDLKYLEKISEIYESGKKVAQHYQIGSMSEMMDTLEFIRDHTEVVEEEEEEGYVSDDD